MLFLLGFSINCIMDNPIYYLSKDELFKTLYLQNNSTYERLLIKTFKLKLINLLFCQLSSTLARNFFLELEICAE